MIQFWLSIALAAAATSGEVGWRARRWDTLPTVAELEIPDRFFAALERHERFRAGREIYGEGEDLNFDFSLTHIGVANGWTIQAGFLKKVLARWFPRATFTPRGEFGRLSVLINIVDSRMSVELEDREIEMDFLKTANPGFDLPDQATVRAALRVPSRARVTSVYASWTQDRHLTKFCHELLSHDVTDIVLVSTQSGSTPRLGLDGYTNTEWTNLSGKTPRRGIIVNQTRGRLPWIHAAADVAVILGEANGVESLHQGRPTLISQSLARPNSRWDRYVRDLTEVGDARTYGSLPNVAVLISQAYGRRPRGYLYENPRIMGRLLAQILILMDQSVRRAELAR